MFIRFVSGVVFIALFLGCCFGGLLPFAVGITLLALMAVMEIIRAYRRPVVKKEASSEQTLQPGPLTPNLLLAGVGVFWPLFTYGEILMDQATPSAPWVRTTEASLQALLIFLFVLGVFRAARTGRMPVILHSWYGMLGLAYVGILFSSFVLVRGVQGQTAVPPFGTADRGAWLMFFIAFCVWATDTFAYLVGRTIGRNKLAPLLSPGKTIEGSLGGWIGAMIAGALFAHWIQLPLPHGLAVGAIAGTIGQLGDLFESGLKREIGIKDFGNILPGHGGVLDRFDSLLFVTPLAYLYLRLFAGLN